MKLVDAVELLLGSAVLIVGLGVSAIAASQESFPGVFIGLGMFVAGYKLSQIAVRETEKTELRGTVSDMLQGARLIDLFMTLGGIGAITYGFTVLFQSFSQTDVVLTGTASALLFLGYVTAHYGVNQTLV